MRSPLAGLVIGILLLASACVTAPRAKPIDAPQRQPVNRADDPQRELHRAVERFVSVTEGRQFDALHALLSKQLRDRYTPQLLARDFDAEPYARDRLARIKARAGEPLSVQGDTAVLEWAPGRSLRLTRESETWKIVSLE